jgi:hypothetical protein
VSQIRYININPDEYKILLIGSEVNGTFMFGSGGFNSDNTTITVSKKENIEDYTIVSDWMLAEKTNNVWR